jgi:putative SOS response-associated peptidase YedK
MMRWGLIPSWAKDPSVAASMINARAETASAKPAFRDAMKSRRWLIPADGFYEWVRTGTAKQPLKNYMGMGVAIGIAVGAGLGVTLHNIPVGVGMGVAFGVVFGLAMKRRKQDSK